MVSCSFLWLLSPTLLRQACQVNKRPGNRLILLWLLSISYVTCEEIGTDLPYQCWPG